MAGVAPVWASEGGRLWRLQGLCPGVTGRVVRYLIFCHSGIHVLTFVEEDGALSVPTCVSFHLARYTVWLVTVDTVGGAMVAHTRATYTKGLLAVI